MKATKATVPTKRDPQIGHVTKAGTNLFLDLGFPPAEARRLQMVSRRAIEQTKSLKVQLMDELIRWINGNRLKQADAASLLMVSRPRVSDVMNRKAEKFTIDMLIALLGRIGKSVRISIGQADSTRTLKDFIGVLHKDGQPKLGVREMDACIANTLRKKHARK